MGLRFVFYNKINHLYYVSKTVDKSLEENVLYLILSGKIVASEQLFEYLNEPLPLSIKNCQRSDNIMIRDLHTNRILWNNDVFLSSRKKTS